MRVPLKWLREIVDVDVPAEELADRLSATGTAVDSIDLFAPVSGIVVGTVADVADVPESKKLVIAQVDAGEAGRVQVLAGAKNFKAGDKVPLALPGAQVTTLDVPVGVRTMLRSYESQGMLCSAQELGVVEDHSGILVLPDDVPVGADVAELLGLNDVVFEFEIYPNRPDQMSVIGIAREVSVLYGIPMRMPSADVVESGPAISELTSVAIEDTVGCPRYLARVIEDVTFAPSPLLVQSRLTACGFRPLGNLVDATNYVLLMTGQPLHAFDLDKLEEQRIVVRRARKGEKLVLIDSTERELREHDLVIADAGKAEALAGVMGGGESEVGVSTKRVLLESAFFDARTISRSARDFHMHTEASARFERGADPEAVGYAAAIASECMRSWAGGRVATGAIDAGQPPQRRRLTLRPERVEKLLGVDVPVQDCERFLIGLGCGLDSSGGALDVVAPSWRPDLEREVDLIEEVARLYGYDEFPARFQPGMRGGRSVPQQLRERVRSVMIGAGLFEATLSSFVDAADLEKLGYDGPRVIVTNPMTEDQKQLRPSLFPGLLRAAQRNVAYGVADVRLFEFGTMFGEWAKAADLPDESEHVAFMLVGDATEEHWSAEPRPVDVFDAKGIIELALDELGVEGWELRDDVASFYHPGRSANVYLDGERVGRFGELRPTVARAFDLESVVIGGLALAPLFARVPKDRKVRELPTQPPAFRDIALSVPDQGAAGDITATILQAGGDLLESVVLMDVYRGEQVGEGRRSLAFRLTFRTPDRTLSAAEVDAAREAIAEACRKDHGAEVR